jgi:hypothetical protein
MFVQWHYDMFSLHFTQVIIMHVLTALVFNSIPTISHVSKVA